VTRRAWIARFRQQVAAHLPESEAGQVLAGVADVESLSRLNKARCIAAALAQLDCRAGETTVSEILQGCACEFSPSRIAAIKQVHDKSPGPAEFWARLGESKLLGESFEVRDGWVVITKRPYRPDLQARHPDDPIEWYCHCGSMVKPLHGRLSTSICQCGAGFYRPLFAALFGAPPRIEVRESLVKGDARCVIAVQIPGKEAA